MSKLMIGSIDLNKIDKTKIVSKDKHGQPFKNGAKYINVAVWVNDEPNEYGHHGSIQMGSKEEKIYIGNLKNYEKKEPGQQQQSQQSDVEDNLPF